MPAVASRGRRRSRSGSRRSPRASPRLTAPTKLTPRLRRSESPSRVSTSWSPCATPCPRSVPNRFACWTTSHSSSHESPSDGRVRVNPWRTSPGCAPRDGRTGIQQMRNTRGTGVVMRTTWTHARGRSMPRCDARQRRSHRTRPAGLSPGPRRWTRSDPSSPASFATAAGRSHRRSSRCSVTNTRRPSNQPGRPRSWSSKPSPTSRPGRLGARGAPPWSSWARLPAARDHRLGPGGAHPATGRTIRIPMRIPTPMRAAPGRRRRPRRVCWPCARRQRPRPSGHTAWRLASHRWRTPTRRGRASTRCFAPRRMIAWRMIRAHSRGCWCCGRSPRDGPRRRPPRPGPCTRGGTP